MKESPVKTPEESAKDINTNLMKIWESTVVRFFVLVYRTFPIWFTMLVVPSAKALAQMREAESLSALLGCYVLFMILYLVYTWNRLGEWWTGLLVWLIKTKRSIIK